MKTSVLPHKASKPCDMSHSTLGSMGQRIRQPSLLEFYWIHQSKTYLSRNLTYLFLCFDFPLCSIVPSVMPSCAYPGFPGILLCGFLCLLSVCLLVMSCSPHEPILLTALLIHDSMHAALPHILLCAIATFS